MLSFAAEFPLKSGSPEEVLRAVVVWLKESPHRVFSIEDLDALADGVKQKIEAESQSVEMISCEGSDFPVGAKHTAVDENIIYSTTVVSRQLGGITWVSIRTDRASLDPQISLKEARKPQIIKVLLRDLGGGLDGELWVSDKPCYLSDADENMAVRLINGDSENHLPVVYLSRSFHGYLVCDPEALARHLGGLAHVIVEPSRHFSRAIQPYTNSRNAYGGAVGIYLPTGQRSLLLAGDDEWQIRRDASEIARAALLTRLPLKGFSWTDLEAERSRQNIEALKGAGSTDLEAFVREFDAENQALREKNEALENEVRKLSTDVQNFSAMSIQEQQGTTAKVAIQDFFPGESDQFIKEAVKDALQRVHVGSRRQSVLLEFIDRIKGSEELEERKEKLKKAISNFDGLDAKTEKILKELGFTISSEGKHHKLVYCGDPRFTFTMAKTPSDWRAGRNMASDIISKVY